MQNLFYFGMQLIINMAYESCKISVIVDKISYGQLAKAGHNSKK